MAKPQLLNRRFFMAKASLACVAATGIGGIVSGCSSAKVFKTKPENGILKVPFSAFVEGNTRLIVRSMDLDWDILVSLSAEKQTSAIEMKCTHRDNPISYSSGGFQCALHGSRFAENGSVQVGPATRPLAQLKTETHEEIIWIYYSQKQNN